MNEDKALNELNANIRDLAKSTMGRSFLWEVLSMCNLYTPDSGKFASGRRSVGIEILGMLEDADPSIYPNLLLKMQKDDR